MKDYSSTVQKIMWKTNRKSTCKYEVKRTQYKRSGLTLEAEKKRAWKEEAEQHVGQLLNQPALVRPHLAERPMAVEKLAACRF